MSSRGNHEFPRLAEDVSGEFRSLHAEVRSRSRRLLTAFGIGSALLLGAMAAGFGWL